MGWARVITRFLARRCPASGPTYRTNHGQRLPVPSDRSFDNEAERQVPVYGQAYFDTDVGIQRVWNGERWLSAVEFEKQRHMVRIQEADGHTYEMDLSPGAMHEMHERWWAKLEAGLRQACVLHLRKELPDDFREKVHALQQAHGFAWDDHFNEQQNIAGVEFPTPFHHYQGTEIRNLLRDVLRDDQLPEGCTGWDDLYMAAVERACNPNWHPEQGT